MNNPQELEDRGKWSESPLLHHDLTPNPMRMNPWRELSALALICLEMSWVVLWFAFLRPEGLPNPSSKTYLAFILNMVFAYTLARMMFLVKLRADIRRYLLFGAYLLATVSFLAALLGSVAFPETSLLSGAASSEAAHPMAILLLAAISALVWLRGVSLAYRWLDARFALRSFRFGAGMLILLGLLTLLFGVPQPYRGLSLFAVSGLLALSAARATSLGHLRGGVPVGFSRSWVLGMLLSTGAVVWLSLVLGNIVGGEVARWAAGAFLWVVRLLFLLGFVVVSPILLLFLFSWPLLESQAASSPLLEGIGRELNRLVQLLTQMLVDVSRFMQVFFESLPDLRPLGPWLAGGVAAVALGMMFAWFGRRWRSPWQGKSEFQDDHGSIERAHLRARLALALKERLGALHGRLRRVRLTPGILGALRIRVLYARLMGLCAGLGEPRGDTLTPLEFLTTLDRLFPRARAETRTMTQAYNRVRYGEIPETRDEIKAVEAAWERLRAEGKWLRQVRKQLDAASDVQTGG